MGYKLKRYMGEKENPYLREPSTHVYAIKCEAYKNLKKEGARREETWEKINMGKKRDKKCKRRVT